MNSKSMGCVSKSKIIAKNYLALFRVQHIAASRIPSQLWKIKRKKKGFKLAK